VSPDDTHSSSSGSHALPEELLRLADASAAVALPPPHTVPPGSLDNRELDKLVGALGRNKATWRRALVLSQWLQESGHVLDDRLCTTVSTEGLKADTVCVEYGGWGCVCVWWVGCVVSSSPAVEIDQSLILHPK
jgi:hypothetical protein